MPRPPSHIPPKSREHSLPGYPQGDTAAPTPTRLDSTQTLPRARPPPRGQTPELGGGGGTPVLPSGGHGDAVTEVPAP